ncbi:hypothetical protein EDD22DRAFT_243716 [Suillus occidentalis]|nr:hypothetical protein EDD22DRAFT_243716 [Suillus occidentalis]
MHKRVLGAFQSRYCLTIIVVLHRCMFTSSFASFCSGQPFPNTAVRVYQLPGDQLILGISDCSCKSTIATLGVAT